MGKHPRDRGAGGAEHEPVAMATAAHQPEHPSESAESDEAEADSGKGNQSPENGVSFGADFPTGNDPFQMPMTTAAEAAKLRSLRGKRRKASQPIDSLKREMVKDPTARQCVEGVDTPRGAPQWPADLA